MRELLFTITAAEFGLELLPVEAQVGAQHDNEAQTLVFARPEEYAGADLIIYFGVPQGNGSVPFEPLNIGADNELTLTAAYTKYAKLRMQAAFFQNGAERAHTNQVLLTFEQSISPRAASAPSIPHRLREIEDGAFVSMTYEGGRLSFMSSTGRDGLPLCGGGILAYLYASFPSVLR